jgi:hypothetical protein
MTNKPYNTTRLFPRSANEASCLYHQDPYLTIEGPYTKQIDDFAILAAWIFMAFVAVVIWGMIYG